MRARGDVEVEDAIVAALRPGPLDLLDVLERLRGREPPPLAGKEGLLHPFLLRLEQRGDVQRIGRSARGVSSYALRSSAAEARPSAARGDDALAVALPDALARRMLRLVSVVRDPSRQGRLQADVGAHLLDLDRAGRVGAFGSFGKVRHLLRRVDRGWPTVLRARTPLDAVQRFLWHEGIPLLGIVVAFFLVRAFLLDVFRIDKVSMLPTLHPHDRVIVTKVGGDPRRYDVITFERGDEVLVKRVIGLGGERVALLHGDVFIDGKRLLKPEALRESLRRQIAAWSFRFDAGENPGPNWRRQVAEDGVNWFWEAPPLRPDGRLPGADPPSGYGFALRDGWLQLEAERGVQGRLTLVLARTQGGLRSADPQLRWLLHAGPEGLRLVEEEGPFGAPTGSRLLDEEASWRLAGAMRLSLGYVDGVLQARAPSYAFQEAREAPDRPLQFAVAVGGEGSRLIRLSLDGDQHWSDDGTVAVAPRGEKDVSLFEHLIAPRHVFVLGDNTTDSNDSRRSGFGDVSVDRVIGPVLFRVWPPARLGVPP